MASLARALRAALRKHALTDEDKAAAALAVRYAEMLDADPTLAAKIGPAYLAALESLGMTPRARRGLIKADDAATPGSPLVELRVVRSERRTSSQST